MGCLKSKPLLDGKQDAPASAVSFDLTPDRSSQLNRSEEFGVSAEFDALVDAVGGGRGDVDPLSVPSEKTLDRHLLQRGSTTRSLQTVSPERLLEVFQCMEASPGQLRFFKVWLKMVYEEALPMCDPAGQLTIIATDLSYMEVRLLVVTDTLMGLIVQFMRTCGIPDRQFKKVEKVVNELKPPRLSVWCKLKNIGRRKPTVDTGVSIQRSLDWAIVDVLMPPVEDQDALRKYALKQRYCPVMYGSSILPIEPEKHLGFEVTTEATHVSQKQLFVASFLFFKSLGFTKPEDKVDRLLGSCVSGRFLINILMGPKGLTRATMSIIQPKKQVAAELASSSGGVYREETLNHIKELLDGEADILDYVADSRGYSVSLGFVA